MRDTADKNWLRRSITSRRVSGSALPLLSKVADRGIVWPLASAALSIAPATRRAAFAGLGAVAATTAVTGVLQQIIRRDRPPRLAAILSRGSFRRPSSPSFPSAHAGNAAAFSAAVTTVYPRVGIAFVPLAVLVSFARVGIEHHYPSDVVAGFVLGAGVGTGTGLLVRRHQVEGQPETDENQEPSRPS